MNAPTTYETILQAANAIVQRDGVARLTIEAVAREAGVSKGGVLYHFPSKEALVTGMVTRLIDHFEDDLHQALAAEPPGPGRWLRAYIRASSSLEQQSPDVTASFLAAMGTNPDLLAPLRQRYQAWQQAAEQDGIAPAEATLLRLAVDGLWFAELLGLAPPTGVTRQGVIAALLRLAGGA